MQRKLISLILTFNFAFSTTQAQNINAFYIGHSLSDGVVDMVKSLSDHHDSVSLQFRYQTIPGSPLRWSWQAKDRNDYNVNYPFYSGYYEDTLGLPTGNFDVLVLTEAVPRYNAIIDETLQYADSFYRYATQYKSNIRLFIYEVWHCIRSNTPTGCDYDVDSNPWRQRLSDDLLMWESVVDTLNNRFNTAVPVCLIPAGQGLAALYDSIQAHAIPGITSIDDLFDDDIHINDIARYFVACIHFSMLHGKSPVGLTNQLSNMWGGNYTQIPTQAQALKFQEIAWQIANQYPKSCLATEDEGPISTKEIVVKSINVFPNPAHAILHLGKDMNYEIVNSNGMSVLKGNGLQVNIAHLPSGLYLIKANNEYAKFVKE